jgi:ribosomal protein S1
MAKREKGSVRTFFTMPIQDSTTSSQLAKLLQEGDFFIIPKVGDTVKATIVSTKGREVRLDINGLMAGVVRGRELYQESGILNDLKDGDEVEATVMNLENENGEVELSFRYAGSKKSWDELRTSMTEGEAIKVKVLDANKGGLLVRAKHVNGFLPVSQLSPDNYPRVSGGDKQKIFDKLNSFIGMTFKVKVLDMNEDEGKLIVSEKAVWEKDQNDVISKIAVGNLIEGEVVALADFGAFVKFAPVGSDDNSLEGLVHISEIAWQRIDHPKDVLTVGQTVKAEIISIEGSKIYLSMKKLVNDPWTDVEKKYKVGETVTGTILKINPFGFFVELDKDIHGLAHVSELSSKPGIDPKKLGTIGEKREFKIVSIESKEHRLGLSVKALEEKAEKAPKAEKKVEAKEEAAA